jgi:hypothetical protein
MSVLWENVRSFRLMGEVRECAVLALFNLRGGSSGAVLDPAAARVGPVADPGRPRPPSDPPTVGLYQPFRVTVAAAGAAETERLLRGYGARLETRRAGGQVHFLVANPRGLAADEHPFATDLARRLRDRGLPVRAFSLR